MTTEQAIRHFGGIKELANFLKIWPQMVYRWGGHPPLARQYELEVRTKGALKAERVDGDEV